MSDELQEMQESAEAAHHRPDLAPVSVTMAILAVLVAAVSLLGHRSHTEELLNQSKASDAWAEYQAKSIRRHNFELFGDLVSMIGAKDAVQSGKIGEKYAQQAARYREDQDKIMEQAHEFEAEVGVAGRRGNRFDLGEVILEASLVIVSMALITKKRSFWIFGMIVGVGGLAVTATGFLLH